MDVTGRAGLGLESGSGLDSGRGLAVTVTVCIEVRINIRILHVRHLHPHCTRADPLCTVSVLGSSVCSHCLTRFMPFLPCRMCRN